MSRRTFVKGLGAGALAGMVFAHGAWVPEAAAQRTMAAHGASMRGINLPRRRGRFAQGRFGFMFPDLPAFDVPLEATDALAVTMRDPANGSTTGNNNDLPSGFTFFGQFTDHDLTMDREMLGSQQSDPDGATNFRSPVLNLDTLYNPIQPDGVSAGAVRDPANPAKLLLVVNEHGVLDLPRNADGTAKLGDPRNEENLIICQLHIAFARFHNRLVDEGMTFAQARRATVHHHQWVVMNDLLPRNVGQEVVDSVVRLLPNGKRKAVTQYYRPRNRLRLFTPLEFAVAAFRFGHSQVRNNYQINPPNRVAIQQPVAGDGNLNGFRPIPAHLKADFRNFFHFPDSPNPPVPDPFNSTRRIDATLSANLLNLPPQSLPTSPERTSLPARNMQRGVQVGLPSGQEVARHIGAPVLTNAELAAATGNPTQAAIELARPEFNGEAPLWFYILAESGVVNNGERIGRVGGTIIAETLAGIMDADPNSYFQVRGWRPMSEPFGMLELLEFAGAVGRDAPQLT
ncbi:MAG: peroxidase family protein [Dehalococcoidia bacterium]